MTYHITGHRSSAGGDRIRRRKRPGKALQGMVSGVVCGYGLLGFARIQGWQQLELGWPELTGMELAALPEFGPERHGVLWCKSRAKSGGVGFVGTR